MDISEREAAASAPLSSPSLVGILPGLLLTMRPKQWTKNLLVFFALFFTIDEHWDPSVPAIMANLVIRTFLAFVLFSMISGAVYIVNDILDVDKDRAHPKKRFRPIPSGRVPVSLALAAAVIISVASVALSFLLAMEFAWVALGYLVLMFSYSLWLKHVVLLDVFAISAGFVLRAVAGAAVLQVPISPWLYTCTGLGALLIALAKRRSELVAAGEGASKQRQTLEMYTPHLLDQFIAIVAPSTLLAYTLYTFTASNLPANHAMMLTIPFVVYGLFRYLYLVHARGVGENPEDIIITDKPLIISVVLWLGTAAAVLAVFR
ncbi:MAG: decaprenyl-phosphate phosphoribosyltransferase [SAR202 cluster bacterium]|nr:decaprenyl-phosphate phosphoribosyltransferase [SAR202 cluster bacterium]